MGFLITYQLTAWPTLRGTLLSNLKILITSIAEGKNKVFLLVFPILSEKSTFIIVLACNSLYGQPIKSLSDQGGLRQQKPEN